MAPTYVLTSKVPHGSATPVKRQKKIPVRSDFINRPGSSSQSAPITLPIQIPPPTQPPQPVQTPEPVNKHLQDILTQILTNQNDMALKLNTLTEKERQRSAREALNASGNQVSDNNNVFISEQERWEELVGHPVRQAAAHEPPRAAGQHLNSDQYVNNRRANLEGEPAARRSGGQGVYPSHFNNDNLIHNNYNGNNQYCSQGISQPNHSSQSVLQSRY